MAGGNYPQWQCVDRKIAPLGTAWEGERRVAGQISDALEKTEAPGEQRTFVQQFAVSFEFPVYFTRDIFSSANSVFADALRRSGQGTHRVALYVDDGVMREMPDLPRRVAAY